MTSFLALVAARLLETVEPASNCAATNTCTDGVSIVDAAGRPLNCAALLAQGFSCKESFCHSCQYAGYCDATCGMCTNTTAHKDLLEQQGGNMFMIIGHQKCGTTLLHSMVADHPRVKVPEKKELHFFTRMKSGQDIDVYLRQFPSLSAGDMTGW
jgi:hypothetical protein